MFPYATRERAAANESWQLIWGIRNFLECVRSVEWSSGISLSRRQRERESEWGRGSKIAQKCAERARELNIERATFSLSTLFGESRFHRHIVYIYVAVLFCTLCIFRFDRHRVLWFVLTTKLRVLDPKCLEYVLMLGNTQSSHLLSTNAPSQRHWPAATLIIDLV